MPIEILPKQIDFAISNLWVCACKIRKKPYTVAGVLFLCPALLHAKPEETSEPRKWLAKNASRWEYGKNIPGVCRRKSSPTVLMSIASSELSC